MSQISPISLPAQLFTESMNKQEAKCTEGLR